MFCLDAIVDSSYDTVFLDVAATKDVEKQGGFAYHGSLRVPADLIVSTCLVI